MAIWTMEEIGAVENLEIGNKPCLGARVIEVTLKP